MRNLGRSQRNLRYRRYLREDANAVVARSPVAHSRSGAHTADHLCSNHQNTAIVAEVVCTLGRLPVRAILTSTQRLPTPPRRPRARTRIGYEDMDRLLTYPDRDNLSAFDNLRSQAIHLRDFLSLQVPRPQFDCDQLRVFLADVPQRVSHRLSNICARIGAQDREPPNSLLWIVAKVRSAGPDPQTFRDGSAHVGPWIAQPLVDDGKRLFIPLDSAGLVDGLREDLLDSSIGIL